MAGSSSFVPRFAQLGAEVCTGPMRPGRAGALAASSTGPVEALVLQAMSGDLTQARGEEGKWAAGSKEWHEKRSLLVLTDHFLM